jgi:N-acetyldiaminopimelate deacetylase
MKNWKEIRKAFHQIPEKGFQEFETQKLILQYLNENLKDYIEIEIWRTGVIVHIKGKLSERKIGFRCDIDGLPIIEKTNLSYASKNIGMMHACGHDFHITFGLILIEKMKLKQPNDDYIIMFQPAEEGPGGAQLLIEEKPNIFDNIDHLFAFHIDPTLKTGVIGYNDSHLFSGTQEIDIKLSSKGGHAAYPDEAQDLTKAFSELYLQIIANNNLNKVKSLDDKTIVHLGKIDIGEARNVFPTKIEINGTIRSYRKENMENEIELIETFFRNKKIEYSLNKGPYYHPVINNQNKVNDFINVIEKEIETEIVGARFTGEDFGFYGLKCKTFMCWIGAASQFNLHTDKICPDEDVLDAVQKIFDLYIT